jgi:hypothetical protein
MTGHQRRELALERLDRVARMRACPNPEDGGGAAQRLARQFECGQRVVDVRGREILRDPIDLFCVSLQRGLDGRGEIIPESCSKAGRPCGPPQLVNGFAAKSTSEWLVMWVLSLKAGGGLPASVRRAERRRINGTSKAALTSGA